VLILPPEGQKEIAHSTSKLLYKILKSKKYTFQQPITFGLENTYIATT